MTFSVLDIIVVAVYTAIMIWITVAAAKSTKSGSDFAMGGKSFGSFATMATQGAAMKGAGTLVGYGGGAWVSGLGALFASQCYNIGGWVSVMIGLARRLKTCGDALNIRSLGDIYRFRYNNNKAARVAGGVLTNINNVATLAVQLVSLAIMLHMVLGPFGVSYIMCLVICSVVVVLCTVFGGLKSVVWTSVYQWWVMTPVIFIVVPIFCVLNGATPTNLRVMLDQSYFSLAPSISWVSLLISGVLSASVDIVYLTRYVSAKDEKSAVRGSAFGFLYTTVWAGIVILFGLTAAILIPQDSGIPQDEILYTVMNMILPNGVIGLFAAALFSATISTVDSYLHVGVVAITTDIIEPFRKTPATPEQELLLMRVLTVVVTAVVAVVVTAMSSILELYDLAWGIYAAAAFTPTILTLYWKKSTVVSCLAGMACGFAAYLLAFLNNWTLPVVWGVIAAGVVDILIGLVQNKSSELLPGFGEGDGLKIRGLSQDAWIFIGCLIGCSGTLILSVGIASWFEIIPAIVGVVILFAGLRLVKIGTPDNIEELRAKANRQA